MSTHVNLVNCLHIVYTQSQMLGIQADDVPLRHSDNDSDEEIVRRHVGRPRGRVRRFVHVLFLQLYYKAMRVMSAHLWNNAMFQHMCHVIQVFS